MLAARTLKGMSETQNGRGAMDALRDLLDDPQLAVRLLAYRQRALGALEAHDRARGADLTNTLRVYLECHGNASRAATLLFLHRNSLLYRLARIQQVLGCDLEDAQERLALGLALLIRP